jgi:hypothetical protein
LLTQPNYAGETFLLITNLGSDAISRAHDRKVRGLERGVVRGGEPAIG